MDGHLVVCHQIDTFYDVNFAISWPWLTSGPYAGPYTAAIRHVLRIDDPQTSNGVAVFRGDTYLERRASSVPYPHVQILTIRSSPSSVYRCTVH